MAHPIFTVESQETIPKKAQVNLLPCRIHHDGDVDPIDTYWNPQDGPEGYYGTIVEKSEPKKPEKSSNDEEMTEVIEIEDDSDDQLETGAMKGKATFDELMVWNHESLANSSEDPYLRGMEEWISFAEQIHSYPSEKPADK
ncbi:hypothetical protein ABKA04_009518 [Annulohypoxylon sp. FPYF3050]